MTLMLFDLVDLLQKKRRLFFVALFIFIDLWLLIFCTQTLQAHRADITARIHSTERTQNPAVYQSDVFDFSSVTASIGHVASNIEIGALRVAVATTDGIAKTGHGLQTAGKATLRGASTAVITTNTIAGHTLAFTGHVMAFPFKVIGHGVGSTVGATSRLVSNPLHAVIRPKQDAAVPVITPEQAQQVHLIQDGTLNVEPIKPAGVGGACDAGAGNGGYPMDWCNVPMDSVRTVSYSNDRINRECTSYAYWYFTSVEGHTDFHVTGNANRWASTSNYPTHTLPAVGAIAVETAGSYGHVAIVEALPGQVYDGKAVPNNYVLVSEMNYDWRGHFRYSYSPLSKFSSYIYP